MEMVVGMIALVKQQTIKAKKSFHFFMPKIKLLDEMLINKIAAGEVIERPASVVKELVENSLDAGAAAITVEADEGGKSRIKVIDNGCGMEMDDALLCIERHATSKISTTDDLFNITTMGFRGEALASISAISQLVLKTKTKEADVGFKILAGGGKLIDKHDVAMPDGTTVEVTDLFFNVPARKKHLKTIQAELRQITELMTKFALCHYDKTLILLHHNQDILFSSATNNPIETLLNIYGKKVAYGMLPLDFMHNEISVKGFVSSPALTRRDKTIQHIFVNRRIVKNQIITKAVYDAYHTLLHLDTHPLFIIYVTISPSLIDVNVHPQKAVIRVEKEQELYTAVFQSVNSALNTAKLIPIIAGEKSGIQAPLLAKQFVIHQEKQAFLKKEINEESQKDINVEMSPQEVLDGIMQPVHEDVLITTKSPTLSGAEKISSLKLIGCIHNIFFLAENELGLLIIDQHAAHERVLYEKFMRQFLEKKINIQELLIPEEIEFSPSEMILFQENKVVLEQIGFRFEEFGRNAMLLRSVPSVLGKFVDKEIIHEVLVELRERTTSFDMLKEERIIRSACRAAVKANDVIHNSEMQAILQQLQQCKQPFTCPHGRPTMIQFTIPELEKKFKRF